MAENCLDNNIVSDEKNGRNCENDFETDNQFDNSINSNKIAIGRKISIKSNKSTNSLKNDKQIQSNDQSIESKVKNRWSIERSNNVHLMKLIVKQLIETSNQTNRIVDSSSVSLNHFFLLFEQILKHGLKSKKGLFETKKDLWSVIELVERLSSDASDITVSARQIPTIRTGLGKARAWIRLALMNKRLPEYFRLLLENREILLNDYYDENALMMSDEAVVVGGLLVGLNILDCNLCLKEEDLDSNDCVIDYSSYLRDNIQYNPFDEQTNQTIDAKQKCNGFEDNISVILDQKNYIEELNRHLSSTITNLEHKIDSLQTDNTLMKEELETYRRVDSEYEVIKTVPQNNDSKLSEEILRLEDQLKHEIKQRETAEKELESQVFLKKEAETALHLLERDVLEKQDTIITLRRQLEDIKTINLQMYNKLQECETHIKNKTNHITHLEQNVSAMATTVSQLEAKVTFYEKQHLIDEENHKKLSQQLSDIERQKLSSDKDAVNEKEWRTTLQTLIDEQQEQITSMQQQMESLKRTASHSVQIQKDNEILRRKCNEYELSLEEIGKQLQDSKLEVDGLKENTGRLKEAVWTSDKDAVQCHQCTKPFSVARRKHHCRSCGEIFCGNCSNNEMPLPSNKKPVRVCDSCHAFLLERYSAT